MKQERNLVAQQIREQARANKLGKALFESLFNLMAADVSTGALGFAVAIEKLRLVDMHISADAIRRLTQTVYGRAGREA